MIDCADIMKIKLEIMKGFGINIKELDVYCPIIPRQKIDYPEEVITTIIKQTEMLLNADKIVGWNLFFHLAHGSTCSYCVSNSTYCSICAYGRKISFCEMDNSNWRKFKKICQENTEVLTIDKEKINKGLDKLKIMLESIE